MSVELRVRGLRAGYGPVEVLHGVDLDFPAGWVTGVLGRNGAGKTTLLRTLAGLIRPTGGRIGWTDGELSRVPAYRRAREGLLLIPDDRGIFSDLTVAENISLFAERASAEAAIARVVEAFPVLGDRMEQPAGTLSGGEQQMLALSRALARPFRVLLVDELSRGLAGPLVAELYRILGDVAASTGAAVLLVDQDTSTVLRLARLVYVLRRGSVVFAGEPADLPPGADW